MTKLGKGGVGARIADVVRGVVQRPHPHPTGLRKVRVIGHRGAPRLAPENTVASFRCALDRGANAIEVDICGTRDGRYVLWHDPDPREKITVARELGEGLAYVANEPAIGSEFRKPIEELSYQEFCTHFGYNRRNDAVSHLLDGDTVPEVRPEPLEALLEFAGKEERLRDVFLDVKLRDPDRAAGLVDALHRALDDARYPSKFHLLCAEAEILPSLRSDRLAHYGDFELSGVLDEAPKHELRCISMGVGQRSWSGFHREASEVVEARDRGELDSVIVWTINEEEQLRALVALGVDGIITDDSELLCRVISGVDSRTRAE
jgi:glycerophosphoryl diester phosphodiesterase